MNILHDNKRPVGFEGHGTSVRRTSFTYKDVLDLLSFGMSLLVVYVTVANN